MYDVPEGYKDMVTSPDRQVDIYMSMGFYIDNTAADDITGISGGDGLPFSNTAQLTNAVYSVDEGLATFEGDGIPTAESAGMKAPPLQMDPTVQAGLWSSAVSDASGNIDYTVIIALSGVHSSALTLYTSGAEIVAGTATFDDGETTHTAQLTRDEGNGNAAVLERFSFSTITVHITKISEAYEHIKLAEIEFGNSKTIGLEQLAGEINYIEEIDPLQIGLPMNELDFDLLNINGDYDQDNPNSKYSRLEIGNPIALSMTVSEGGTRTTVPIGTFVIGEKHATDLRMSVVAYDTRFLLTQIYTPWSISTSEDLGTAISTLLAGLDIACSVDPAVNQIYPAEAHTFSADSAILDDIQAIAQAYGLAILPGRDGQLMIKADFPSDDYGAIPVDTMISWPLASQMKRYNFIDVGYGQGQHYTRDLRDSANTARQVLSIYNPLIISETMAQAAADRIEARIYAVAMRMEWMGDPALTIYDTTGVYSRWTQGGTPAQYKPIKRSMRYNGMLSEETTFVKGPL